MKKSLLLILLCTTYLFSYAQKETKELFSVQVSIAPSNPLPEKPVTYFSVIETPIEVSKAQLETYAKTNLSISGSKFTVNQERPEWLVKLVTSNIKITSRNEKPINEIDNNEYLIKYYYGATLIVTDQSKNVLFQSQVAESEKEQELPKSILFLNPAYKVKLTLAKNNPAKTKALVDEMMTNVNALILEGIVDKAGKVLDNAYENQEKSINMSLFSVKGKAYDELNAISEKITAVYLKYRAFNKKNRVPKEDVDNVMREALPVWEKYIANNKELEEKATKGLILNCAVASTWLGDYAKASEYLSKVPEAKMPSMVESSGTATILSFDQSAENAFYFNQIVQEGKGRATFVQ